MDIYTSVKPKRNKLKLISKIIIVLLVLILALCVYGLFFERSSYNESRAIIAENTELKKQVADLQSQVDALKNSQTAQPEVQVEIHETE